jgi:hypothetical protein
MTTTYNQDMLQDAYMLLDADDVSAPVAMNGVSELAIQCDITDLDASLAGEMSVQESNNKVTWADTGTPVAVTGDDLLMFEYSGAASYVRIKWNQTAGKGGVTFRYTKKS